MTTILGIDPGLKGGLAFYDGATLFAYMTPVNSTVFIKNGKKSKRNEMDLVEVWKLLQLHDPDLVYLEQVSARPGQGVTSMFRFGQNFGQLEGIVSAHGAILNKVRPQEWKKTYGLRSEKNASLEMARTLFPDNLSSFKLKKHDGVAEAALIAKYGYNLTQV